MCPKISSSYIANGFQDPYVPRNFQLIHCKRLPGPWCAQKFPAYTLQTVATTLMCPKVSSLYIANGCHDPGVPKNFQHIHCKRLPGPRCAQKFPAYTFQTVARTLVCPKIFSLYIANGCQDLDAPKNFQLIHCKWLPGPGCAQKFAADTLQTVARTLVCPKICSLYIANGCQDPGVPKNFQLIHCKRLPDVCTFYIHVNFKINCKLLKRFLFL